MRQFPSNARPRAPLLPTRLCLICEEPRSLTATAPARVANHRTTNLLLTGSES